MVSINDIQSVIMRGIRRMPSECNSRLAAITARGENMLYTPGEITHVRGSVVARGHVVMATSFRPVP